MHSNILEHETSAQSIRDKIIEFRDGLPGFPASRCFVMAQRPEEKPFVWMHSVSDPGLTFALVDAYAWDNDYTLEIDDADLMEMGSLDPRDYTVYFIVQIIQKDRNKATLQVKPRAPVLVNVKNRQARQVTVRVHASLRKTEPLCLKL
jgi:flagellar assembly factor FliW